MDNFEKKTLTVARGYTYTYHVSPTESESDKISPGLLFCHGFPDSADLWQYIAPQLLPLATKHRIIIPDLLGAGETSKPTHSAAYTFTYMTKDLVEIMDAEQVKTVIPIGHDWGSMVAQRVCLHAPDRVSGLILLNVAYSGPNPGSFGTVDDMNKATKAAFGYNAFEYWKLFLAPDGAALLSSHPEKCWEVWHGGEEDWMKRMFCTDGGMRKYLEDDSLKVKKLKPYAQDEKLRNKWIEGVKRDGLKSNLMYYKCAMEGCHYEAERDFPRERVKLEYPVLFIGCDQDVVCRKEAIKMPQSQGLLPDLQVVELDCGHWCPFEKPDAVAAAISSFLKQKFSKGLL